MTMVIDVIESLLQQILEIAATVVGDGKASGNPDKMIEDLKPEGEEAMVGIKRDPYLPITVKF